MTAISSRVRYQGKTFTVRLIGVDTPENSDPEAEFERLGSMPADPDSSIDMHHLFEQPL